MPIHARRPAALAAATVALVAGCGGSNAEGRAGDAYRDYLASETQRDRHEDDLNSAFRDLAAAAGERDRERLDAAVGDARAAARRVRRALERELVATADLVAYDATRIAGRQLARGLDRSRRGLDLFEQQLDIAERDPFRDRPSNADEVSRLARHAARLSVAGGNVAGLRRRTPLGLPSER